MSYPMWNAARTGILVDRGNGIMAFLERGPEFDSLKVAAPDWHDHPVSVAPPPPIEEQRAAMVCSRLQGRLVLGEATCAAIDAQAADPLTPWAMRQAIAHAIEWQRTSQAMTELGYLLGYTDTQMDDLFGAAMTVQV